jgi:hypothetical protein
MQNNRSKTLMKLWQTLAVSLITFLTVISYAQESCEALFSDQKNIQRNTQRELELSGQILTRYKWTNESMHLNKGGILYGKMYGDDIGRTSVWNVTSVPPSMYEHKPGVLNMYLKLAVTTMIDTILNRYGERRDWSRAFRGHLVQQAKEFSLRSTFINYETNGRSPNAKGSLRIISAKESQSEHLPADINLGIKLPYNGGVKYELASFIIDKEMNHKIFSEILLHLMVHADKVIHRPQHEPNKLVYFTYADAASYKMYKRLGFVPVPNFLPTKSSGTEWQPMGISAENILKIPELMKKTRPDWNTQDLNEIINFFPALRDFSKDALAELQSYFYGKYEINFYRPGIRQRDHLERRNGVLELIVEKIIQDHFELAIYFYEQGRYSISIPTEFLPLREGFKAPLEDGKYQMSYSSGTLKIEERLPDQKIRTMTIKVDRNFHYITGASIVTE